jgi:hypothetical protein
VQRRLSLSPLSLASFPRHSPPLSRSRLPITLLSSATAVDGPFCRADTTSRLSYLFVSAAIVPFALPLFVAAPLLPLLPPLPTIRRRLTTVAPFFHLQPPGPPPSPHFHSPLALVCLPRRATPWSLVRDRKVVKLRPPSCASAPMRTSRTPPVATILSSLRDDRSLSHLRPRPRLRLRSRARPQQRKTTIPDLASAVRWVRHSPTFQHVRNDVKLRFSNLSPPFFAPAAFLRRCRTDVVARGPCTSAAAPAPACADADDADGTRSPPPACPPSPAFWRP